MFDYTLSISSEPVLTFGILLFIILIIPLFFQKLKLPGIVGLLFAGMIIGPGGFGIIEAKGVIDVLGKVGLLYLMFLAGLEINLQEFKKDSRGTIAFGIITFLLPMILGTSIFLALGYSIKASLLIASMFASHTLVAYPIIVRMGLTKDKSVVTAVGGTIITDTAALLVLAVIARSTQGELNTLFWIQLTGLFSMYVAFMFLVLPAISYRFFRMIGERGRFTFVYVFGAMMMCAWLAEWIGVEAIVGAFLSGLAFNPLLSNKGALKNRIEFFGDAFFIPFFLIFVGMQVDFKVLSSSLDIWVIMGVMSLTVLFTKGLAAYLSGKILSLNSNQIWVLFGLTQSQAAATLAAVFVGIEIGLLGEEILNGTIMMILVTCIIGPIIIDKFGYKLSDPVTIEAESDTQVKKQRILIPMSNPKTTARLIECAANFGESDSTVLFPLSIVNTVIKADEQRNTAQKLLDLAVGQVHATGFAAQPVVEDHLNIAEGIKLVADKHEITDILMGWNGNITTSNRVFGTILDQVLASSEQRLFVCKLENPISTFRRVVLALPPKVIYGKTFLELYSIIHHFAENLNTPLALYFIEQDEQQIQLLDSLINRTNKATHHSIGSTDQFIPILLNELLDDDLLILANDRANDYGWFYGTNMLPRTLNQKRSSQSFIIAYPFRMDATKHVTDLIFSN